MNWIVDALVERAKKEYLDPLIRMLRVHAARICLEGFRVSRRVAILLCLLIFIATMIGAGFVLIPLALLMFMPWEPQTKAIVGVAVGAIYVMLPLVGIMFVLSEKRWMALTGARDAVDKLLE